MKQYKLCELVWDANIYPRTTISDVNVSRLAGALEMECELPPIVVEKGTLRIIDGVHRRLALIRIHGEDAMVNVVERVCRNDNEAFLLAIELNAVHGLHLTPSDITRNAVRAQERGITLELLSKAARVPLGRIERRMNENTAITHNGQKIALKGVLKELAGTELTEQQEATNKIAGGMHPVYYIHQLQSLIESGLWEWGSPNEKTALQELFLVMKRVISSAA